MTDGRPKMNSPGWVHPPILTLFSRSRGEGRTDTPRVQYTFLSSSRISDVGQSRLLLRLSCPPSPFVIRCPGTAVCPGAMGGTRAPFSRLSPVARNGWLWRNLRQALFLTLVVFGAFLLLRFGSQVVTGKVIRWGCTARFGWLEPLRRRLIFRSSLVRWNWSVVYL